MYIFTLKFYENTNLNVILKSNRNFKIFSKKLFFILKVTLYIKMVTQIVGWEINRKAKIQNFIK